MAFNIVLIEPEIPNNTGNIGRLCLATGSKLHLVKPYGFEISDSRLKRAGLDYWQHIDLKEYESKAQFFDQNKDAEMIFLSAHASKSYLNLEYKPDQFLVFGKESVGLDKSIIKDHEHSCFHIPIQSKHVRSLNLANAVAVVSFEGLRKLKV